MKQVTLTRELTERILGAYRKIDHLRPKCNHFMPIEWNGKRWCAATDAHNVVLVPENEENKLPMPNEDTVDIVRIIPVFDMRKEIKVSAIEKALSLIPIVDIQEMAQCESCDGDCTFEHYGHSYACKECDETGEVETGRTFKGFDEKYTIGLRDTQFNPDYFKRMLRVVEVTGAKSLRLLYVKTVAWFELDNGIIIGMSALNDPEDKKVIELDLGTTQLATTDTNVITEKK